MCAFPRTTKPMSAVLNEALQLTEDSKKLLSNLKAPLDLHLSSLPAGLVQGTTQASPSMSRSMPTADDLSSILISNPDLLSQLFGHDPFEELLQLQNNFQKAWDTYRIARKLPLSQLHCTLQLYSLHSFLLCSSTALILVFR